MRKEQAASPKRPNKLGSNNTTAGIAEQYGKKCKDYRKEQENGLKEEKPIIKQKPSRRREQALKNEKPENGSRHKKPRMGGRMCRQASKPRRTHE